MCDTKEYTEIYNKIKNLSQDDTMKLVLEASTEEERDFYEMISDYFLQKRQQNSIARNVY